VAVRAWTRGRSAGRCARHPRSRFVNSMNLPPHRGAML
jgi:hypothetical protein